jgi:hypothetical protein
MQATNNLPVKSLLPAEATRMHIRGNANCSKNPQANVINYLSRLRSQRGAI